MDPRHRGAAGGGIAESIGGRCEQGKRRHNRAPPDERSGLLQFRLNRRISPILTEEHSSMDFLEPPMEFRGCHEASAGAVGQQ
jgi:hypothetical protein